MRLMLVCALVAGCGGSAAVGSDDAPVVEAPDSSSGPFFPGEQLVRLPTRPSVTLPFALASPASPTAVVVLFAGSDGLLRLDEQGIHQGASNFVVRTRQRYADAGMATVLVDVPSDHPDGLGDGYRTGSAEGDDLAAVFAWVRARTAAPLWLVGTSRGTISAANVAARDGRGPLGLVLTSSITTGPHATLYDVALDKLILPTLFVHHKQDACPASPFDGARTLRDMITTKSEFVPFDGGGPLQSEPCGPLSYHGYVGLDQPVTQAIVDYIKKTTP